MDEAQELFDKYATPVCPSQLTAPNLHRVLNHAPLRKHIWGAKGVGSQVHIYIYIRLAGVAGSG